jgi:peptidoglycan/LPS O-acetylase OafA/YrhL
MAVGVLFLTTNSRADFHSAPIWWQLGAHLFLVHNFNEATFMGINGSFWSLAIEAQLYLLYPLLLVMVGKFGWRQTMVALACCEFFIHGVDGFVQTAGAGSTVFGRVSWLFSASPLGYWFSWTLGARMAESFLKNQPSPFAKIPVVPWLVLAVLSYFIRPALPFLFVLSAVVTAIAVSKLLCRDGSGVQAPAFILNVLRKIGVWSYSIYLLHQPFLNAVSLLMSSLIPGSYRSAVATFLYFLTSWLVIILISALWYHVFELPGIAIGKWIIQSRVSGSRARSETIQMPATPVFRLKKSFYAMAGALFIAVAGIMFMTTKLHEWDSKNELELAEILTAKHKYAAALRHYQSALDHNENSVDALNNAAWLLATAPNPRLRDGRTAVALASRACELTDYKQPFLIGTLAAACAEAGHFDEAITNAQKAQALALSLGQFQIAARDQQLLELYQSGKAFHEVALAPNNIGTSPQN